MCALGSLFIILHHVLHLLHHWSMFTVNTKYWHFVEQTWNTVQSAETQFLLLQKLLSGTQDLSYITSLELCVDTLEYTLGNFGKMYSTPKIFRH